MRAWIARAGRAGERQQWALDNGYTGGGFGEVADLTGATTREAVLAAVVAGVPKASDAAARNFSAQLWALRERMSVEDLVVMPLKPDPQLAIGRITGDYRYLDEEDAERRHVRPVEWRVTDVPRTAIRQDLLHTLGAFSTYCGIVRHDGAWRIEQVLHTGRDPGARVPGAAVSRDESELCSETDADSSPIEIERYALDQIATRVIETFSGHRLAELVAAILTAEGYVCEVSPPGADQGIDVVAGTGPLGMDPPRIVVQVKSEPTAIGDEVVQRLEGALGRQHADQGLLVAWGGVTRQAHQAIRSRQFILKLWNADEVLARLFHNYDRLPALIQAELPLKQVWTLVEES